MVPDHRRLTKFGAQIAEQGVRFRLWAPNQQKVSIAVDGGAPCLMCPVGHGWYEYHSAGAKVGALYKFILGDGLAVPDPASRFQPSDVHGPSEVIDPNTYVWKDIGWQGRPWEQCILYELHVGTFTPEGTFSAAIGRLDWLVDIGITAVELMPVADFPGGRNWGYDGVLLFAPDSAYGRPDDFKAFVDAAHARGIMVFLDVVYNHFGPDGNYLPVYSPIFTDRHKTPWGAAVNYDAEGSELIRQLVIENACYWIEEFHLDGLRLDAVHAIKDDSNQHVLEVIADSVKAAALNRPVHLLLENEENQASLIARTADGAPVYYTAQWNDDVHHVLHAAATGETAGYYVDYAGDTEKLGRALAEGFAFQGDMMGYRGRPRGEASGHLPPTAFVAFIQNHDQVGNRAFGDRLTSFATVDAVRAVAAVYLLLPQIPMIFMGEEFGASNPFPFFCDFEPELAKAVREGRREEFARFPEFKDPHKRELIPDPTSRSTFESAKLDWSQVALDGHADWARFYKQLIAIRHREIIPRLKGMEGKTGSYQVLGRNAVSIRWILGDGSPLHLIANLSDDALPLMFEGRGRAIWPGNAIGSSIPPWSVFWAIEDMDGVQV
ncbi:malto-oligosyltrehalose trehalohydrolase [uncultured Bradyrhizobium sp.]|uniref:malto-oligosyltrehalose trehalohydrolase n=1 Tax=uncultured Bradyrhizobium sp. TaxID=199684 RepID=UPI0035CBAA13